MLNKNGNVKGSNQAEMKCVANKAWNNQFLNCNSKVVTKTTQYISFSSKLIKCLASTYSTDKWYCIILK
jgi:hypothetical protein